eukprot:366352-Chlamydomonas_euryale.AAC.2
MLHQQGRCCEGRVGVVPAGAGVVPAGPALFRQAFQSDISRRSQNSPKRCPTTLSHWTGPCAEQRNCSACCQLCNNLCGVNRGCQLCDSLCGVNRGCQLCNNLCGVNRGCSYAV